MATTFKSKATGDLVMTNAHAEQVLQCLKKTALQPGILQPHEMAAALLVLRSLPELSLSNVADDQENDDNPDTQGGSTHPGDVPMSGNISLRKRAWPLVHMIETAQAANQAIVWGV